MNEIKIVLQGGLKGCCTQYTTSQMKVYTKNWFSKIENLKYTLLDVEEDYWEGDPLADLAYKYLKDKIFPLTYLNDQLVMIGHFPEKEECLEILESPKPLTAEFITETLEKAPQEQSKP